ncbi:hypothetical protein CAP35_01775 [Chitinophagaceae bacterium IBVUCB1]|nr:hypothetical protein CAP35_01775 [Chitinophagaceae bacterium IBVUCB1]
MISLNLFHYFLPSLGVYFFDCDFILFILQKDKNLLNMRSLSIVSAMDVRDFQTILTPKRIHR